MNSTILEIINDGGITEDMSTEQNSSKFYCEEWPEATEPLFQGANALHLAAFFIPHTIPISNIMMRSLVGLGQLIFVIWAIIYTCAADVVIWNSVLMILNFALAIYLAVKICPPFIQHQFIDLYKKVFKPLKVDRRQFKELIDAGEVRCLDQGEYYAIEDVTHTKRKLSILLEGKIRVSCDSSHLHFVFPNQFLDSPEWEATDQRRMGEVFQVTLVAEERSHIVTWTKEKLDNLLEENSFLATVLHCLIGMDITTKLYSLSDYQKTCDNRGPVPSHATIFSQQMLSSNKMQLTNGSF